MNTRASIKDDTLIVSLPILKLLGLISGIVVPVALFFNWLFWLYLEHRLDDRYARKDEVVSMGELTTFRAEQAQHFVTLKVFSDTQAAQKDALGEIKKEIGETQDDVKEILRHLRDANLRSK
ncbi:MAG: hypothetical protein LBH01_02005 [Verrucomicrobiales bacterium]|nr:hypothetical protein [Verrucomicrobiales bacterium]